MKHFTVQWYTVINGVAARNGYSVVTALSKRGARVNVRSQVHLNPGEKLCVASVAAA